MNWLHLSDFHVGDARGAQDTALRLLVETIESECSKLGLAIDLVILAGDLAYSGSPEEYDRFREELLKPLRKIPYLSAARFLTVPGNHDVHCKNIYPMVWNEFPQKKRDSFFCEDADGVELRAAKATAFKAYCEMLRSEGLLGPDPSKQVSCVYEIESLPVTIVATNTAFFSDENEHKRQKSTPIPLGSLRRVLTGISSRKPILLVGHHSPDAFVDEDRRAFRTLLREKRAIYIHGHEHDPSSTFTSDGSLLTLGFGACYTTSLESRAVSRYRNSFAFCSLDNRLFIRSYLWDCDSGRWSESTASQFLECKDDTHPKLLTCKSAAVPRPDGMDGATTQIPLGIVPRAPARPSRILPIGKAGYKIFQPLFKISEYLTPLFATGCTITDLPSSDERYEICLESEEARHLVVCIPGTNHVLSKKEVETLNTRLDTEDFVTATILCLGRLSEDARTIYLRFKRNKKIEILANSDLVDHAASILSAEQNLLLGKLDGATSKSQVLVSESAVSCLVLEGDPPNSNFYVVAENGSLLSDADELITAIRKGNPEFARMPYKGGQATGKEEPPPLSENTYLAQCYKEYNSTKYAALAHVGLRFADLPLSDLYVNATACEVAGQGTSKIESIVSDHLADMPMTDALRSHIQKTLLASLEADASQESSDAREFCQRYAAVLLTGDPGAGKTCFVKNEILAYCSRAVPAAKKGSDWHFSHIPIMVQLSEVVAETDIAEIGFLVAASRLLARRGISAPAEWLTNMAAEGRLALFFDGLDEVVSIEKRALVVRLINEFCQSQLSTGNRVVVTSRPAAVQIVNLLPTFHKLELQGLSESNIALLANRILSLKLIESKDGAVLDQKAGANGNSAVLEKLLEDCRTNPGVGRLAQNPLLLTLLILIYANSGAPSAKRHSIYEQAIRTLSSVRRLETGHVPISTQDIRERLGAVALSVYRNESGLLPTRRKVAEIVRNTMTQQRGEEVPIAEADEFIQRVAEATGLISIGKPRANAEDPVVTFMHHSFLEYFAAIGLSLQLDANRIEELVHKPRWREILTLLAGIIGENADIAPYLGRFLKSVVPDQDVDSKVLSFAMDCALECDVASESTQRLLIKSLRSAISAGPPKVDPWVRRELGERLDQLITACGSTHFEAMFLTALSSTDDDEIAATIRICTHAFSTVAPSIALVETIESLSARHSDTIQSSICAAAGENPHFRTSTTLKLVSESLSKSRRRRHTAFDALARIPSLATAHWPELISGIDDDDLTVKRSASRAAIQAGLNADLIALSGSKKDLLLRALRYSDEWNPGQRDTRSARIKVETLERLLDSADKRSRLMGIALLPMSEFSDREIYDQLIAIVRTRDDREEVVAALGSLRYAGSALSLMTQGDTKWVMQWVDRGTADVRSGGIRLIGLFSGDVNAINYLKGMELRKMDTDEFAVFATSIGGAKILKSDCSDVLTSEFLRLSGADMSFHKDNLRRISSCLDGLKRLEQNIEDRAAARLQSMVGDYRVSDSIRGAALCCLAAVAAPTPRLIAFLTEHIRIDNFKIERDVVQVPSILAKKCRQEVDYVLSCVKELPKLRSASILLYKNISSRSITAEIEVKASELRSGINELGDIIAAFDQYISEVAVPTE